MLFIIDDISKKRTYRSGDSNTDRKANTISAKLSILFQAEI